MNQEDIQRQLMEQFQVVSVTGPVDRSFESERSGRPLLFNKRKNKGRKGTTPTNSITPTSDSSRHSRPLQRLSRTFFRKESKSKDKNLSQDQFHSELPPQAIAVSSSASSSSGSSVHYGRRNTARDENAAPTPRYHQFHDENQDSEDDAPNIISQPSPPHHWPSNKMVIPKLVSPGKNLMAPEILDFGTLQSTGTTDEDEDPADTTREQLLGRSSSSEGDIFAIVMSEFSNEFRQDPSADSTEKSPAGEYLELLKKMEQNQDSNFPNHEFLLDESSTMIEEEDEDCQYDLADQTGNDVKAPTSMGTRAVAVSRTTRSAVQKPLPPSVKRQTLYNYLLEEVMLEEKRSLLTASKSGSTEFDDKQDQPMDFEAVSFHWKRSPNDVKPGIVEPGEALEEEQVRPSNLEKPPTAPLRYRPPSQQSNGSSCHTSLLDTQSRETVESSAFVGSSATSSMGHHHRRSPPQPSLFASSSVTTDTTDRYEQRRSPSPPTLFASSEGPSDELASALSRSASISDLGQQSSSESVQQTEELPQIDSLEEDFNEMIRDLSMTPSVSASQVSTPTRKNTNGFRSGHVEPLRSLEEYLESFDEETKARLRIGENAERNDPSPTFQLDSKSTKRVLFKDDDSVRIFYRSKSELQKMLEEYPSVDSNDASVSLNSADYSSRAVNSCYSTPITDRDSFPSCSSSPAATGDYESEGDNFKKMGDLWKSVSDAAEQLGKSVAGIPESVSNVAKSYKNMTLCSSRGAEVDDKTEISIPMGSPLRELPMSENTTTDVSQVARAAKETNDRYESARAIVPALAPARELDDEDVDDNSAFATEIRLEMVQNSWRGSGGVVTLGETEGAVNVALLKESLEPRHPSLSKKKRIVTGAKKWKNTVDRIVCTGTKGSAPSPSPTNLVLQRQLFPESAVVDLMQPKLDASASIPPGLILSRLEEWKSREGSNRSTRKATAAGNVREIQGTRTSARKLVSPVSVLQTGGL